MLNLSLSLWANLLVFCMAAAAIGIGGVHAAKRADQLADRTGLGEALVGTVFLGLLTALPGLVASVVAALKGHPVLAISNAMGGIAVQTAALALADVAHREANLEHAAASATNMLQTTMLVLLLTVVVGSLAGPDLTVGHVHPGTLLLFVAAAVAFVMVVRTKREPMWRPRQTAETVEDVPDQANLKQNLPRLTIELVVAAGVTAGAGALVAETAENLLEQTTLHEAVIGALLMAVATSLPEVFTSVAAVRRGALTLAVSDIVGGNFFDVLFVAAADLAYIEGSLFHGPGVGPREVFVTALTILLNVVLLGGLIYRQKRGPGNIGLESLALVVLYVAGALVLAFGY